jgi:hypothetical protein
MLPVNATGNQSRNSRIPLNALFLLTGSLTIFVFLMFIDVDLISTLKIGALFNNSAGLAYSSVRFALNLIVAFLAFGTFMGARMRAELREQADSGDEGKPASEMSSHSRAADPVARVVSNLDIRISRLIRTSEVIYWTIIISLIAGVFLIIFAGSLSAWDTTLGNITSRIEKLRSDIRPFYDEETKDVKYGDDQRGKINTLDTLYEKAVLATIERANARPEGKSDVNWPSTILRIGVIGMLVFLTQILISLYRYNSRLIAFYGSRRDALILADRQTLLNVGVEKLSIMLLPSNFDFGREPRHPLQEMIGFLRGSRDRQTAQRSRNHPKRSAEESKSRPSGEAPLPA